MREIPAEVRDLLKSRSMIGENKPSYEVTVGNGTGGINIDKIGDTAYAPLGTPISDTRFTSSCQLADGRVLVIWCDSDKIRQGYAESAESLFADNSVTNVTDLFTGLEVQTAMLNQIDEGLFLSVAWKQQNGDKIGKVLLYKSAKGDGTDWLLHATIQILDWSSLNDSFWGNAQGFTKILKIDNRFIIQCPQFKTKYQSCVSPYFAIYDSYNLVEWNLRHSFGIGLSTRNYHGGCSSNFIVIDSVTYFAFFSTYAGGYLHLIKSTDGFLNNQSEVFTIRTDYGDYKGLLAYLSCAFFVDLDKFYIVGMSSGYHLSLWSCNKNDIGDYTKYSSVKKIFLDFNHNSNLNIDKISNGYAMWAEDKVIGIESKNMTLPIKSINISRNKNMAGSLSLSIDNKNGEWSPDGTVNQNTLFPNTEITVKQGYGAELVQTFNGLIDRIEMSTFPQSINLSIRDKLKLALDQIITPQVIAYTGQTVEDIFIDLAGKAGLTTGVIETTGLTIAEKTFSWETYADCFSWLADLVGFEFGADEEGKIYFKKDSIPQANDWILTFADGIAQAYFPIVENSDVLKSADGLTTYVKDTDYEIDYETGELTSINIPNGETLLSYVFASYVFKEGEDIISLGYTIDDNDIYSKVIVYGKDANDEVISSYKDYVSKDYYNVLSQKIMKIDVSEASTVEQLQAIADRAEMLMRSRVRTVNFAAVAVPWLQIGDLIQVVESSTTISEMYRITDLSTSMDNNGYTMQITCYHHSA